MARDFPPLPPRLIPTPEMRVISLERRQTELEWVVYGMLGVLLFFAFICRR